MWQSCCASNLHNGLPNHFAGWWGSSNGYPIVLKEYVLSCLYKCVTVWVDYRFYGSTSGISIRTQVSGWKTSYSFRMFLKRCTYSWFNILLGEGVPSSSLRLSFLFLPNICIPTRISEKSDSFRAGPIPKFFYGDFMVLTPKSDKKHLRAKRAKFLHFSENLY